MALIKTPLLIFKTLCIDFLSYKSTDFIMEKKGSSDVNESRSKRRETSERKADQADSKDEAATTGDPPAVTKNRRKRASDENGWMTNTSEGTGSRHAVSVPVPVDDDEPKDSHTTR